METHCLVLQWQALIGRNLAIGWAVPIKQIHITNWYQEYRALQGMMD